MEGSYGNVFPAGRTMSPKPQAASGNQYKVNVNRQKTKKWANFKPQNYDGDDWGAEDDDGSPHDAEPPLPPKPTGPRHPAAHSPTGRQFHPVGSPPLRTNTHQYSTMPGQSPIASGPPRRVTEPFGASPYNTPGRVQPQFSPDPRRASPSPQSAHPLPSQLPPQLSTPGSSHFGGTTEGARQSGSSPRPGDSPKPWMGARTASPQSARPLASPDKPLPFIRPADVYQRLEEERARERRSQEAGRASADSPGIQVGSPAGLEAQPPGVTQTRVAEGAGTGQATKPATGVTPVAERQSEYGLESFLASYGSDEPTADPYTMQEQAKSAEPQESAQSASHEDIRRYSTSPQLPNLTRLSGFGEELFSSTSFFPAPGPRSPLSGSMQLPTSGQPMDDIPESPAASAGTPGQSTTVAATHAGPVSREDASQTVSRPDAPADAVPSAPNEPDQDQPAGLSLHQSAAQAGSDSPQQQTPAAPAARAPASSTEEQPAATATRPRLPGSWVTETPSTPAELPASPPAGASQPAPDKAVNSEGVTPTDGQPDVAALDISSPRLPNTGEASATSPTETAKELTSTPSHPSSPRALAPLRTSSSATSAKSGMSSQQAVTEATDQNASRSPGIQAAEPRSPIPASAATDRSEIPPTAPLNPRRGSPETGTNTQQVLSPAPVYTEPNPDSSAQTQVKDSDVLREEIMKSLGPLTGAGRGSIAAYHAAAADPARESSYLGDVYDDYWAATEEKAEPVPLVVGKVDDAEKPAQDTTSLPAGASEDKSTVPTQSAKSSTPPSPSRATPTGPPEIASGAGERERRFSWDAAGDGAALAPALTLNTTHTAEQKASSSGPDNVVSPIAELDATEAQSLPLSLGLAKEKGKSAEDLRAEAAPEFNPAPPRLTPSPALFRPLESPSPVSDMTGRQGDAKRMSLAEEKIVLRESSHPASPTTPPLEQHPAFVEPRQPQPRQVDLPDAPPAAENIVGFRTIMEMPSPAERIKTYNDTRRQFAAMDMGLEEWLKTMLARHPEHADAAASYPAMAPHMQQQQGGQGAGTQASHGGLGLGGRGQSAHLHMPHLQHGLSGLGHSSGQVGTKSKELLMAAGKAGKGLFSKGRNKLRGTGDKVFSNS